MKNNQKVLGIIALIAVIGFVVMTGCEGPEEPAGQDGTTITISEDGYWVINGVKTEHKAIGQDGKDGQDGFTSTITVSEDGFWVINGTKTTHKAIGQDGTTPTITISEDGYWVINGVETTYKAIPEGTVGKTNPAIQWPTGLTALCNQLTLADITLPAPVPYPGVFTWANPTALVGDVGEQTHNLIFTPTDTEAFNIITNNVTITVFGHTFSGGWCSVCGVIEEMVNIPAGTFVAGTAASGGPTTVTMSAFRMGKYEVTQEQWETVMQGNTNGISATPSSFSSNPAAGEVQARRPVNSVTWYEVILFCNRLSIRDGLTPAYRIDGSTNPDNWGAVPTASDPTWNLVEVVPGSTGYRLPTEAQWEYACRAGTTTNYSFGDTWSDDYGWISENSNSRTREVGKKLPNAWGLYDMHGNVAELCWDWWGSTYPSGTHNPTGASSGTQRLRRGGGYNHPSADVAVLPTGRESRVPEQRINNQGFRVALP